MSCDHELFAGDCAMRANQSSCVTEFLFKWSYRRDSAGRPATVLDCRCFASRVVEALAWVRELGQATDQAAHRAATGAPLFQLTTRHIAPESCAARALCQASDRGCGAAPDGAMVLVVWWNRTIPVRHCPTRTDLTCIWNVACLVYCPDMFGRVCT